MLRVRQSIGLLLAVALPLAGVWPAQKGRGPETEVKVRSTAIRVKQRKMVRPIYPAEAKEKKIEGLVKIRATIGKQGKITKLKVEKGHPILAAAAKEAIWQWEYEPTLLNGEAVEVETTIDVIFQLAPDKKTAPRHSLSSGPASQLELRPAQVRKEPVTSKPPGKVQGGRLKKFVSPKIPEGFQLETNEKVEVEFVITKEGKVRDVRGINGNPALLKACFEAIRQWEYQPTLVDGQPVEVQTRVTMRPHVAHSVLDGRIR